MRRHTGGLAARYYHEEFESMAKGNNRQKNDKKNMKAKKDAKKPAMKTPKK